MENRRLGQSDRGGGTKKRHRARSLIGLTLAGCVALGVSSCSATIESDEQTATAEQKILGPDARVVYGAKGAVDFVYTIGDLTVSCTGSIIAPHVVLTAARCLLPQNPYDAHDGERDITINYYDPVYGRRVVHTGNAQWHAHPSFPDYSLDPGILNEADTSKNDIAVIIVPEQLGSLNTGTTDYHDYLRIFAGNAHDYLDGHLNAFGAGLYEADRSDDQLRYGNFDTDVQNNGSPGPDFLKLEGRQGGDALRMCRGDNGGLVEYSLNIEGQSVPTVAAVWSNYNVGSDWAQEESQDCANDNHGHDDSYACILNNDHVAWIESAAGLSCVPQSGANIAYKRCFDLPMIEDAPGEGLYAPNVATAIVMSTPS